MDPDFETEEAIKRSSVVIDCTPRGIGHSNKLKYYERFKKIVEKLKFSRIKLEQNYVEASELILSDRKHLDNNPLEITKNDIISLLKKIND